MAGLFLDLDIGETIKVIPLSGGHLPESANDTDSEC